MAQHLNSPVTVDGVTYKRIPFRHIANGHELYQRENGSTAFVPLGTVTTIATDYGGTLAVILHDGKRLTRSGWQSKKLWRKDDTKIEAMSDAEQQNEWAHKVWKAEHTKEVLDNEGYIIQYCPYSDVPHFGLYRKSFHLPVEHLKQHHGRKWWKNSLYSLREIGRYDSKEDAVKAMEADQQD